jgi:CubicO group peptidase (beta-lactamase class C family)
MPSLIQRVDALFAKWDNKDSPGCVLAVIKDGKIIHQRGYGMADLERGIRITPDSIFDIGSTGKQFTATVIAILANQGQLSLDDPIRRHLPEMPSYADDITIRHLIHHTSGLRDYLTLMDLRGMDDVNVYAESPLLDIIIRQKGLNFKPGNEYLYSNSGYFLLGTIAQRVTGKHITELIKEHILDPLGMANTTFNKDFRPIIKNRAMSYNAGEEEGTFVNSLALSGGFGDGPIITCIGNLLSWDRNFYDNKLNNSQVNLIEQMYSVGKLNNGKTISYAFGLEVTIYKGQRVVQHDGAWAGYRSEMMRFPDQRMTFICLSNLGLIEPAFLCQQVADIYLENVLKPEIPARKGKSTKSASSNVNIEDLTGLYQSKLLTFDVFIKDKELFITGGIDNHLLVRQPDGRFKVGELPSYLAFSGTSNKIMTMFQTDRVTRFKRIGLQRYQPSSLSSYAGTYYSPELDVQYGIIEADGALAVKRTPFDDPRLVHVYAKNALRTSIGEFRLAIDKDGNIKGFTLYAGRVKNIKFRKIK